METVIIFVEDEGKSQVAETLLQLQKDSLTDSDKEQLLVYVTRAFLYLKAVGIPSALNQFFVTKRMDEGNYTILIAKKLRNHRPLLEFRVNWRGAGAFRAIFFEYLSEHAQVLVFYKAMIKETTYSDQFEQMIQEAKAFRFRFLDNPEKYIHVKQGDE